MSHIDNIKIRDFFILIGVVSSFVAGFYFIDTNRYDNDVFNSKNEFVSNVTSSNISKVSLARDGHFIIQTPIKKDLE